MDNPHSPINIQLLDSENLNDIEDTYHKIWVLYALGLAQIIDQGLKRYLLSHSTYRNKGARARRIIEILEEGLFS